MLRWLSDCFCNIRINAKLSIGFGIILLLTMIIAATGWYSTHSIIERSDKISQISSINSLIKTLSTQYAHYQRRHSQQAATDIVQTLDLIEAQHLHLASLLTTPEERKLLSQQQLIAKVYRAHLARIGESFANRDSEFSTLENTIGLAGKQLNEAVNDIVRGSGDAQQGVINLQSVRPLFQSIQQLILQVHDFDYTNDPEKGRSALAQINSIINEVGKVHAESKSNPSNMQQTALALAQYREHLRRFCDEVATSETVGKQLFESSAQLEALNQNLIDYQASKRASDVHSAQQTIVASLALAVILGVLAAGFITRQIVKPLQQTLKLAECIASGDLTQVIVVERRDELGQLQHSMQRMVMNLRNLIGNISNSVMQITDAAERLSTVATQTSSGIHTQKNETEQVASAMNEMAATVQEVAHNAQQAQLAAVAADQQACGGEVVVGQVIEQIERQAIEVGKSTTAMNKLKEQSDRIGSVLDVIRSVAMQTNLLALNAAIEAARAGDFGRGFAVVADEVRSLAQRTQQSTEEIEELIISLQDGAEHVASVLETSRELAASSVDLTRQAGTSLEQITRTVSTIQQMNQQIATAAEQQALVAMDINRSVLNVRDITQRTASASDHTASSSAELNDLGKQLEHIVKQFQM